MSRPSTFTQEKADYICQELAEGRSLRKICEEDGMPSAGTVCRWLNESTTFQQQYTRAREAQADALFEQILDIADDGRNDTTIDEEGNKRTDHDVIARSRLRVDARKWMAGKLRPKRYGERLELAGDPDAPMVTKTSIDVTGLSTQALAELVALRDATDRG